LDVADPALLSWRLYFYNRIPASPRLKTLLGSEEKIAGWLGLNGSPCRELLRERWKASTSNADLDGWLAWRSLGRRSPPLSGGYKLYVSPAIHRLREAIYATAEAASLFNAYSLKMGRDVYGLLRPDKIVVYFDRFEDLKQAGAMILNRLAGCEAQGVPFTAELGGEGLLSWGSDPPADWQLRPASGESWRLFVTNRLATALLTARHSRADACVEPWQFVSYRAGLDGIDTTTWAPATVDWLHTPRQ
jgi:hypothetical protein